MVQGPLLSCTIDLPIVWKMNGTKKYLNKKITKISKISPICQRSAEFGEILPKIVEVKKIKKNNIKNKKLKKKNILIKNWREQ